MIDISTLESTHSDSWSARGYRLEATPEGLPLVEGDTGQFYCDAVANDCGAAFLMEHLRQAYPKEYARYREDAADDGIDLDESQDVFVHARPAGARSWG